MLFTYFTNVARCGFKIVMWLLWCSEWLPGHWWVTFFSPHLSSFLHIAVIRHRNPLTSHDSTLFSRSLKVLASQKVEIVLFITHDIGRLAESRYSDCE